MAFVNTFKLNIKNFFSLKVSPSQIHVHKHIMLNNINIYKLQMDKSLNIVIHCIDHKIIKIDINYSLFYLLKICVNGNKIENNCLYSLMENNCCTNLDQNVAQTYT